MKIWISSQVFFKDFIDRFGTTCFKNGFPWRYFSRTLLTDFRKATDLKSGSSRKYSWRILFIDHRFSSFHNKNNFLKVILTKYWKAQVLIFLVCYQLQIPTRARLFTFHSLLYNWCMHLYIYAYMPNVIFEMSFLKQRFDICLFQVPL